MRLPLKADVKARRPARVARFALCVAGSFALLNPASTWAADGNRFSSDLVLSNDYIAILLNTTQENTGRFSIQTTGGDPERPNDESQPLTYGTEEPWTSFTTVRVDGRDYVFGGPTEKRAGRSGPFGEMVEAPNLVDDQLLRTAWRFGDVEVTEQLSLVRGSTTGLLDTAHIEYVLTNRGDSPHQVGLRLVLDTMLGANDGAPFRLQDAITTDTMLLSGELPDFWQAFDSLADPRVIAQGTFRGAGVTRPDRVIFTNWGLLADETWMPELVPGRDFTRRGEYELDSAIALFYDPALLRPGESYTIAARYGVGGISIAPGSLALGLTSPTTVTTEQTEPFDLIAYVGNSGEDRALSVEATLDLSGAPGFELVSAGGAQNRGIGDIAVGETVQVGWKLRLKPGTDPSDQQVAVRVRSVNSEPNQQRRTIGVVTPGRLVVRVQPVPPQRVGVGGASFHVSATVENVGGAALDGVNLHMPNPPVGLSLSPAGVSTHPIGQLRPGDEVTVAWPMTADGSYTGDLVFTPTASAIGESDVRGHGEVSVERRTPNLYLRARPAGGVPGSASNSVAIAPGGRFVVTAYVKDFRSFTGARLPVEYDPDRLRLIDATVGSAFARCERDEGGSEPWVGRPLFEAVAEEWTRADGRVGPVDLALPAACERSLSDDSLVHMWFEAQREGDAHVAVGPVAAASGRPAGDLGERTQLPGQSVRIHISDGEDVDSGE